MTKRMTTLSAFLLAVSVPALGAFAAPAAPAAQKTGAGSASVIVSAAADRGAAPLNAFMVTPSSVHCVQGGLAIGADGKAGIVAPVVGATVLRGSTDLETAVTWKVVALDGLGAAERKTLAQAYTVCTRTR